MLEVGTKGLREDFARSWALTNLTLRGLALFNSVAIENRTGSIDPVAREIKIPVNVSGTNRGDLARAVRVGDTARLDINITINGVPRTGRTSIRRVA